MCLALKPQICNFKVVLSNPVEGTVTVDASTITGGTATGGTAIEMLDFVTTLTPGITFASNVQEMLFDVVINDDFVTELDETVFAQIDTLVLSDAGLDVEIGTAGTDIDTATGTIIDDDDATITVVPQIPDGVNEGSTPGGMTDFVFDVTISHVVDAPVSFDFSTQDGTATAADNDYLQIIDQNITFLALNNTPQTLTVSIQHDSHVELDEPLRINHV